MNCPLCSQPLERGELVMVCHPCHQRLGGGLDVNATGEFRVLNPDDLAAIEAAEAEPPAPRPATVNVCAWCGKLEAQVQKLLGRGGTALCNECVALAADIMEAELGPHWR